MVDASWSAETLLMEEILHHLTCMKPNNKWWYINIFTISTGAGFLPSTVVADWKNKTCDDLWWPVSRTPQLIIVLKNAHHLHTYTRSGSFIPEIEPCFICFQTVKLHPSNLPPEVIQAFCFKNSLKRSQQVKTPETWDGWKTSLSFWEFAYFRGLLLLVSGSVLKAIMLRLSLVQVPKNLFGQNSCPNLSPLPSTTQVFGSKRQWCPMHRIGELDHLASATVWRSLRYMDVSKNRGILPPIWMVKIMENPIKMGWFWGAKNPYFWFNTHMFFCHSKRMKTGSLQVC